MTTYVEDNEGKWENQLVLVIKGYVFSHETMTAVAHQ